MEPSWIYNNLKPPPFLTIAHSRSDILKGVQNIKEALQDVRKTIGQIENSQYLDDELSVLRRVLYKIRNNMGREKVAKGLKMVNKCLHHWKNMHMAEVLKPLEEDFKTLASVITSQTIYIQSALCIKYVLQKVIGAVLLLAQTIAYSMHTFLYAYQNLLLKLFIPKMLTFMALTSRIRILSLLMMQTLFPCYKHAYQLLIGVYGEQYAADLPENLEHWVKHQGYYNAEDFDKKVNKSSDSLDIFLSKYNVVDESEPLEAPLMPESTVMEEAQSLFPDEDTGMKIERKSSIDLGLCQRADETKVNVQKITSVLSKVTKCKSRKKLLTIFKSIHSNVLPSKRDHYSNILQQLESACFKTTNNNGDLSAGLDVIKRRMSSFLESLIGNSEENLTKTVLTENMQDGQNMTGLENEAVGEVPELIETKVTEKGSGKVGSMKQHDQLTMKYKKIRKLWQLAGKQKGKSTKMMELLLKVEKEALRYKPKKYKKLVKAMKQDTKGEKLGQNVRTLLEDIITAMKKELEEQGKKKQTQEEKILKLKQNKEKQTKEGKILKPLCDQCSEIRTELEKGSSVSKVLNKVILASELVARYRPEKYLKLRRKLASQHDDSCLEHLRPLILNFVDEFRKYPKSGDELAGVCTSRKRKKRLKKKKLKKIKLKDDT